MMAGDFRVDRELLAYMTPEHYFGLPQTQRTDQFSLGLIAVELISGEKLSARQLSEGFRGQARAVRTSRKGRGPLGTAFVRLCRLVSGCSGPTRRTAGRR